MDKAQEKRILLGGLFNHEELHAIDPKSIMISTTWSDWRYENKAHPGVKSNLEIQIVTTSNHSEAAVNQVLSRVSSYVGFSIENIEHKKMGAERLSLYNNDPNLVFPTRFFDSVIFFDPSWLRSQILRWISQEIIEDGRLSSKMYDRFRWHKRTMESWKDRFKGEDIEVFNVDKWIFYYDPDNFLFSVKNGPLRYIQYMLAVWLMRYIRDMKKVPWFLDSLPTNIWDRLEYIRENSLSSKNSDEIWRLKEIYEFFLYLYHEMQYRHFSEGETKFYVQDIDTLKDIRDMMESLREAYKIEQFYPTKKWKTL